MATLRGEPDFFPGDQMLRAIDGDCRIFARIQAVIVPQVKFDLNFLYRGPCNSIVSGVR